MNRIYEIKVPRQAQENYTSSFTNPADRWIGHGGKKSFRRVAKIKI